MARIRTVKPEFWSDSLMVQLPPLARLLYVAIWTAADDHGCLQDEPERLAMEVMPREDPAAVDDMVQLLIASGRMTLCASEDGWTYLEVARWADHQRIDRPSKSRISREGSRKIAISLATRRAVGKKYGCSPGSVVNAACYYCGSPGKVHWWTLADGRPSAWVTFPGLELDHLEPEGTGGESSSPNIVLACRRCNRSKGSKHWVEALCSGNGVEPSAIAREDSRGLTEGSGKERKGKERISEKTFVERDTRALAVFEHWRTVWRHPQATFDAKRRKRIEARLKEFTVGQLQSAISGFLHSPWHCGTDPKGNGTVYDGIETLLRDASQVERGLALLSNPPHAPRAENASERILRKLNGTDERVIEHEPETQPLALPSR